MSRLYGVKADIDPLKVKRFFDERACREDDALNAVMLQSTGSTLAFDRDRYERENLLPVLTQPCRILDLGCGAGRVAMHYAGQGHRYLGLDFSDELIARGRSLCTGMAEIHFEIGCIPDDIPDRCAGRGPFDLIVIAGLLMYLNDDALRRALDIVAMQANQNAIVYIRETISDIDRRLTLRDFPSEELHDNYNGIYRHENEIRDALSLTLVRRGFGLVASGQAFPAALRNRAETVQHYFRLER